MHHFSSSTSEILVDTIGGYFDHIV